MLTDNLRSALRDIARDAGRIAKQIQPSPFVIPEWKPDGTSVTAADRALQELYFERIRTLLPDACFWGEEEDASRAAELTREGVLVLVDPIDGTNSYRKDIEAHWATSLAIFQDGQPLYGLVHVPDTGRTYEALVERGEIHANGRVLDISHVGEPGGPQDLSTKNFAVLSHSDLHHRKEGWVVRSGSPIKMRIWGSYHLSCIAVARGQAGAYLLESLNANDTGIALPFMRAAGGDFFVLGTGASVGTNEYLIEGKVGCTPPLVAALTAEIAANLAGHLGPAPE